MKRHALDPLHFSLLKSLDESLKPSGLAITDEDARERLIEAIRSSLDEHVDHTARLNEVFAIVVF
ncbi:MAG: hypothetical protein AAGG48_29605 [Planctomycetota bacterium]